MQIDNQKQAVYAVQTFLYELGLSRDWLPSVYPNGEYGEVTREAVRQFQTRYDLPVTGTVDGLTWSLLYGAYRESKDGRETASIPALPEGDFPLRVGSRGYGVILLRATLNELSAYYPALPRLMPSSLYQYSTANAVRKLEGIYRLEETGEVNVALWNRIFADLASKQRADSQRST